MSETKHTPGPLEYCFEGGTVAFIVEPDGTVVAKLSVIENTSGHSALVANTRLFVAAPELLEALEALLKLHDDGDYDGLDPADQARAAIAKAKGEKRWRVTAATGGYIVYDSTTSSEVADSIPTREAAERIAAIYEEVMP